MFLCRLMGVEMNYEIHEKDLLVVIACMKDWDVELRSLANLIIFLVDHMNLKYFEMKIISIIKQIR